MIRKSLPFLAIIALIVILFMVFFMKSTVKYSVDIPFPLVKSMDYIRNPKKISKWMAPFANDKNNKLVVNAQSLELGKDTLQILKQGYLDMKFRRTNGKDSLVYLIESNSRADTPYITSFVLSYTTTPWKKLTVKNPLVADAFNNMDAFKNYMSNPLNIYGYVIRDMLVTDTSFLFASRTIPLEKFAQESKSLFDMLITEAQKRNADYNGVRIFHFQDNGNGTTSLFAGVGVNRKVYTQKDDNVSYKLMPYKLNLLVADFEGPYKDIQKAYEALEAYKEDNKLYSMAIPFHKYISDGYGFADTQIVKMRVSFPVY